MAALHTVVSRGLGLVVFFDYIRKITRFTDWLSGRGWLFL
jgi:hypothetical protein